MKPVMGKNLIVGLVDKKGDFDWFYKEGVFDVQVTKEENKVVIRYRDFAGKYKKSFSNKRFPGLAIHHGERHLFYRHPSEIYPNLILNFS